MPVLKACRKLGDKYVSAGLRRNVQFLGDLDFGVPIVKESIMRVDNGDS